MSTTELDKLKQSLLQQNIKYLLPSYVDMHGVPKTKMVPIAHLERMMSGSELFTGAALDGVPQDVSDEEVAAVVNHERMNWGNMSPTVSASDVKALRN